MFSQMDENQKRKYIDCETALGRIRGNKKLYSRMLTMFLASAEFEALENALKTGDLEKGSEAAHTIKGMAANLGLDKIAKSSEVLMVKLRKGENDENAYADYRDDLKATRQAIAETLDELGE